MKILESVGVGEGLVTNEHPVDPGRHPFPSTWNLAEMHRIERKLKMERVIFPQSLWGLTAQKLTCISGTVDDLQEFDVLGNGKCNHDSHAVLVGRDKDGNFMTRRAQTYPSPLCKKLAELYIRSWERGSGNPTEMTVEEWEQMGHEEEGDLERGMKVPCPEVAAVWDPLERWVEEGRWVWGKEEHNNILEARASVIALSSERRRRNQHQQHPTIIHEL